MSSPDLDNRDPRNYLAEDRTFLAWIRTSIALMGFGFVVARFGLFLRELEATQTGAPVQTTAFSVILGTALITGGVAVTIVSSFQYARRVRELRQGLPTRTTPSKLALAVAVALSVAGSAMAIYLGMQKTAIRYPAAIERTKPIE